MATHNETAAHCCLSERHFNKLIDRGVFERAPRGMYDLDEYRTRYIRYLQEVSARRKTEGELDPPQERARKDKELADKTSLQNAVTRGELFSGAAVSRLVIEAFINVRTKLLALPTKLAPIVVYLDSIPEVQAVINDGINDALGDLSERAVLAAAGAATARGIEDAGELVRGSEASAEADGEPMGRRRAQAEPRGERRARAMGHGEG